MADTLFVVETPLRITELMYNPADPTVAEAAAGFTNNDDFEFIELMNIGAGTIGLGGVSIVDGVGFTFPAMQLGSAERTVVVRNRSAFEMRYPDVTNIAGEYGAGAPASGLAKLSNNSETVVLMDAGGGLIQQFTYDDACDVSHDDHLSSESLRTHRSRLVRLRGQAAFQETEAFGTRRQEK